VTRVALPLAGITVVVTRARGQAGTLVDRLHARGATTVEVPLVAIEPAADGGAALRAALADPIAYDWVVVTSTNGVHALVHALGHPSRLAGVDIAVVGPRTADELRAHALEPRLVPARFVAEGLLAAFPDPPRGGGRVLLAQADRARAVLASGLRERGWSVDAVEAYRTVTAPVDPATHAGVARAEAITFTSASTVEGFVAAFDRGDVPPIVACIGPVTAAAARQLDIPVTVTAAVHTIDGLVDALVDHVASTR
jgi:uroporphyrinogen-III synthase